MPNNAAGLLKDCSRAPWNKGKLIGAKPPLRPKHVWSIRTRLMIAGRAHDLAMFNLAIDSKLRGCDVVALRVEDVAPNGYTVERATVRQRKTGRPVKFELTEQTRQAIEDYLRASDKKPGEFLFTSRRQGGRCMTTRQYARLVAEWIGGVGLDPRLFGTHSLRRTKATPDLSAHRQPAGRATPAWPHEDRKHGPISRHRGRRRAGNSGTS
jgi:integrase